MSARRHPLTPAVQARICHYIRLGAFPHVAAEACGVPREVFELWLARGRRRRPERKYRLFREEVLQAQAEARMRAESRALVEDALSWLKSGPGKETPASPGWANPSRPQPGDEPALNPLLHAETQQMLAALLRALEPFPEARAAAAAALAQLDAETSAGRPPPADMPDTPG
jgi:hypothetical protein